MPISEYNGGGGFFPATRMERTDVDGFPEFKTRRKRLAERRRCLELLAIVPAIGGGLSIPLPAEASLRPQGGSAAWAKKMFAETSHNFGTVTRNTPTEYRFQFQNLYEETVSIRSVRTSCSCTKAVASKSVLKSHETAAIIATVDTVRHHEYRSVTITVSFDRPYSAEAQLEVYVLIRDDIQFFPNEVRFAPMPPGIEQKQSVRIRKTGTQPNWAITNLQSSTPHLLAELYDRRAKGVSVPDYELVVTQLKAMPHGRFREEIILTTNDTSADARKLSLTVVGEVTQELTLSPETLFFGQLRPNETLVKNLILHGDKAFRVTGAAAEGVGDSNVEFRARPSETKSHLIAVELTAGHTPGVHEGVLRLQTNVGDRQIVVCSCRFEVLPPEEDAPLPSATQASGSSCPFEILE